LGSCKVAHERINQGDLPRTVFDSTVYRSGTGAPAVILDDPNDQVLLNPGKDTFRFKKEGLQEPQRYLDQLSWKPDVYRLRHRKTEIIWGYLLLSPELHWRVTYNQEKGQVVVWIEDPHTLAGP
jgi:hypothetical protein